MKCCACSSGPPAPTFSQRVFNENRAGGDDDRHELVVNAPTGGSTSCGFACADIRDVAGHSKLQFLVI